MNDLSEGVQETPFSQDVVDALAQSFWESRRKRGSLDVVEQGTDDSRRYAKRSVCRYVQLAERARGNPLSVEHLLDPPEMRFARIWAPVQGVPPHTSLWGFAEYLIHHTEVLRDVCASSPTHNFVASLADADSLSVASRTVKPKFDKKFAQCLVDADGVSGWRPFRALRLAVWGAFQQAEPSLADVLADIDVQGGRKIERFLLQHGQPRGHRLHNCYVFLKRGRGRAILEQAVGGLTTRGPSCWPSPEEAAQALLREDRPPRVDERDLSALRRQLADADPRGTAWVAAAMEASLRTGKLPDVPSKKAAQGVFLEQTLRLSGQISP